MRCRNGRVLKPEILDTLPPEEARGSLADLARINKHWGGHSTLRKLIDDVIPRDEPFTFLDVGSASGDMARCLREWRPRAQVTCLDYIESHLEGCSRQQGRGGRVRAAVSAAQFRLRFQLTVPAPFHGRTGGGTAGGFGRVARKQVLVIDLWRHPVPALSSRGRNACSAGIRSR